MRTRLKIASEERSVDDKVRVALNEIPILLTITTFLQSSVSDRCGTQTNIQTNEI